MKTELVTTRKRNLPEGIARGERAVEEGRTLTHDVAKAKLSRYERRLREAKLERPQEVEN